MMTIEEVKNISFRRAGRNGYLAEDVDKFIDEVLVSLKQYETEKSDIMKKIEILAKRLEKYRADEEIIKNALIRSERIAENALAEAQAKADAILKEAKEKADKMVLDANNAVLTQKEEIVTLETGAAAFRSKLLTMYEEQINLVKELPDENQASEVKGKLDEKYAETEKQTSQITAPQTTQEPAQSPVENVNVEDEKPEEIRRVPLAPPPEPTEEEDIRKTRSFSLGAIQDDEEITPKRAEKKRKRFPVLKFGDSYDVEDE